VSRDTLARELAARIRALAHKLEVRSILRQGPALVPRGPKPAPLSADLDTVAGRMTRLAASPRPEIVLIGVSTGGPAALARIMPVFPADLGVPILIVQHMPPVFTQSLAESLASKSAIPVREAVHGEPVVRNTAYIAPGGRHMRLAIGTDRQPAIQITDDPPENNCRPAVDYLFRSVANQFSGQTMAVILTGMGSDGTLGLRLLKRRGCYVIAQDEASCTVYGMPKAAVDAGVTDTVLPLDAIAAKITLAVKGAKA
jgi:two-component system, chemotaxis family, protein-glutamate methylesterase/glutaminase